MKKRFKLLSLVAIIFGLVSCGTAPAPATDNFDVDKALAYCDAQIGRSLAEFRDNGNGTIDYTMVPRNIMDSLTRWNLHKSSAREWCAGFWPGILWYDYEATGNEAIRKEAENFTKPLEILGFQKVHDHDLGFLVFCSAGNGYRLTGNERYKEVILNTADTLATIFDPVVGTIHSWPRVVDGHDWPHNTIIDNMMNLEMLLWAAKNGGEEHKYLYDIAVKHADVTMEHHFKPDYSCYHVAVYSKENGEFLKGVTHQGYGDNTMWARGQAWAINGYTMMYRETQDPKYLDFAQKVTDVYLKDLPSDYVPFWDFSAPGIPNAPRDASAAAIIASALLDLGTYVGGEKGDSYLEYAKNMLISLSSEEYQSGDVRPSFLDHSTGHHPKGSEVNASIIYADYYYIEALLKYKKMYTSK